MIAEAVAAVPAVRVDDIQRRVQQEPCTLVIDVRDSGDAQTAGAIPEAINIGYGALLFAADNEVPEAWRDPRLQDRDRPIVTHCVAGPLGAIAAKTLTDMGFTNVAYMEGGIEAWKAAGLPLAVQPGLVHHSDRGVQYAARAYADLLRVHGIQISMSRRGNPYDNAQAESFMKTLKYEEVHINEYEFLEDARASIGHFLEEVYNHRRLHSALGYCPPAKFEALLNQSPSF
jgi:transposase InsO family protein